MHVSQHITLRDGSVIALRSLEKQDTGAAIFCLRKVSGETEFLMREISECGMTLAQEEEIIQRKAESPRELLLGAFAENELIGMAGLNACGPYARVRHRASVGLSLLRAHWGKGIGTLIIGMLVKFAFEQEKTDVLHCLCEDYNLRSRRIWEKNGFSLILTEPIPQPHKGKFEYHYRLTKEEYRK